MKVIARVLQCADCHEFMKNWIQYPAHELFDQLPVGVFTLSYQLADNSFSFILVNKRFCEIMGLSQEAIMEYPILPLLVVLPLDADLFLFE